MNCFCYGPVILHHRYARGTHTLGLMKILRVHTKRTLQFQFTPPFWLVFMPQVCLRTIRSPVHRGAGKISYKLQRHLLDDSNVCSCSVFVYLCFHGGAESVFSFSESINTRDNPEYSGKSRLFFIFTTLVNMWEAASVRFRLNTYRE